MANQRIMSSVTPALGGDIKSGQDSFLLTPVSRIDLANSKESRNFWVYIDQDKVWSATGVSKDLKQIKADRFNLQAGLLWQRVERENKRIGLKSELLSFVPSSGEPVEIMQVKISNISRKPVKFTPFAAIPLYGRSADNLRDHRDVTSLLQRITLDKFGVIVRPLLSFDERGHKPNKTNYFVLGWDRNFKAPEYLFPTQGEFCGEAGDLEAPLAVLEDRRPDKNAAIQGRDAMGALRFRRVSLEPGASSSYIILLGISDSRSGIKKCVFKFSSLKKVQKALEETKKFWQGLSCSMEISSGDSDFDNWFRWVSIQPVLRKIFGCSFLPDFDYGRGGRGWRDLWQDCLGLILSDPGKARGLLINNFSGVRIDGTNATIIGRKHGEFIPDRNKISRVWMDHGVWPLLTLDLYINETGDFRILFEEAGYFCDCQGGQLKTNSGKIYKGTVLEHLLAQNLRQFFNVGEHNHTRLEGADWNDGLDMASERGESVAFSAMYARNLLLMSGLLVKTGRAKIKVAKELKILLQDIDYDSVQAKRKTFKEYSRKVKAGISGKKASLDVCLLAGDLKLKAGRVFKHIRRKEWLKEGFFNGYYDNAGRRVEGKKGGRMRMMLASQVFPLISGAARRQEAESILKSAKRYLFDKRLKGFHLNTDFKEEQHRLGRAFSFVYGDKENGAFFSHMNVLFADGLYKQGFAKDGWQVLKSIYNMALNTEKSRIFPCLPEYFNAQGRGRYSYLTGSASWFALTLFTQVFGVRGQDGDLVIQPNLAVEQFKGRKSISISRVFAGRRLNFTFFKPEKSEDGRCVFQPLHIPRKEILALPKDKIHTFKISH